ncbi:type II secretion system F family protein [Janibacter sp. DB-40]|uniref:type II secretion system F family protein n=1 Tax=Janibacter sp. DB-40 TaxID=3028808 RepID=UPI0024058F88|nr:type II secretion system F family protein [Janibacter sp. DB-40]
MSFLVGAIPGLVALLVVLLCFRGYHLLRSDPSEHLLAEDFVLLRGDERKRSEGESAFQRLASGMGSKLRAWLPAQAIRWLQRQVDVAGRPQGMSVDSLLSNASRWIIILTPVVILAAVQANIVQVLLAVAAVIILPLARLSGMARKRREQIDRDLPDFLDVLAVTVSAGVGFRSALGTVAQRFEGPIGEEVMTVLHQINNGASVRSAFTSMRQRADSDAMDEFVTAYLQSEELGAPLADTLNQIAAEMRKAAAQRMRQLAARIEPRVTMVITAVMVPGAMILIAGGMYVALGSEALGSVLGG